MESLLNLLIDGIICFGLVSIMMIPVICFTLIMEKLDDKYHWYDKLFNNDENEYNGEYEYE